METRTRIPLLLLSWAEKHKPRSNNKRGRWADLTGKVMSDWQVSQRIRDKHRSRVKNINTVQRERGKGILMIESQWVNGQDTHLTVVWGGNTSTPIYRTTAADTLFKQGQSVGFKWILCPLRPASIWTFLVETSRKMHVIIKLYVFNCKNKKLKKLTVWFTVEQLIPEWTHVVWGERSL